MNRKFRFLEDITETYREPLAALANSLLEIERNLRFKVNCFNWWMNGMLLQRAGFSILLRKARVGTVHYTIGGVIHCQSQTVEYSAKIQDPVEFGKMWEGFTEQVKFRLSVIAEERAKRRRQREYNKEMRGRFEKYCGQVSKVSYNTGC